MTNKLHPVELSTQAPSWLELLASLMPETVKIEVSGYLVVAALVALWIWRRRRNS